MNFVLNRKTSVLKRVSSILLIEQKYSSIFRIKFRNFINLHKRMRLKRNPILITLLPSFLTTSVVSLEDNQFIGNFRSEHLHTDGLWITCEWTDGSKTGRIDVLGTTDPEGTTTAVDVIWGLHEEIRPKPEPRGMVDKKGCLPPLFFCYF